MLILKNVNKKYQSKFDDVQAVNDVNLTFDNQGMYFLVGKSGCGKTTLLNCLGLLDDFDSGSYLIDGVDILNLSRKEKDSFRN